jgi:hypothetical protein
MVKVLYNFNIYNSKTMFYFKETVHPQIVTPKRSGSFEIWFSSDIV